MDFISDYFAVINFYPISTEAIVLFVILVLLLTMSWILSASEVAFFALEKNEIEEIKEENENKRKTIIYLKRETEQLLAVIVILRSLVNISIIILSSFICSILINFSQVPVFGFICQIIGITVILLIFSEIMPKIYATQNARKFVSKFFGIYPFLIKLLYPFIYILISCTKAVNKRLEKHRHNNISVSELSQALELTVENIKEDKNLLEGIIRFGNISVVEIMTSRVDTIDVNIQTKFTELIKKIIEYGYSRMPVYVDSHDNIKGILYIKDLLPHLDKNDTFRWQTLIRPAYFVPETKKIDDLLEEFQTNKIHMAIVVDEFGGTSGIITMEDILEEIIGEINDEYDEENDKNYHKIDNHTFIFEAKILLNDFFKLTEIEENDFSEITDDADTLAGILLELRGEIPKEKDKIEYKNYIFEILKADNRKIEKVKLYIKNE